MLEKAVIEKRVKDLEDKIDGLWRHDISGAVRCRDTVRIAKLIADVRDYEREEATLRAVLYKVPLLT